MKIQIQNQSISIVENEKIVANSVNLYTVKFSFDETWNGFVKTAVFEKGSIKIEVLLNGDECFIPWEVLAHRGYLRIGVRGFNGNVVKPTVWLEKILIADGTSSGTEGREPTPDILQQIINLINSGAGSALKVSSAKVGQTIIVKEVDENGRPTEWEAVDFPDVVGTLVEAGLISPIGDSEGILLSDENTIILL